MNNVLRFGFAGIVLLGAIVALPNIPAFAMEIVAQGSTPTPPVVIPAWILGGGTFYRGQQATAMPTASFYDVDPGAMPDQHFFAGVLDASTTVDTALGTNCPGIGSGGGNYSNCNPYLYINMLDLLCSQTLLSTTAYNYLNNGMHEPSFLHYYASPPGTPGPRATDSSGNCPSPRVSPTPSPGPSAGYYTNPDDFDFQSWLVLHAWTTATFPAPFGIYEDHFSVVGDPPCYVSYEYGGGPCNMQGTSSRPAAHDWETALGDFESNAEKNCKPTCFAFVGNGLTPGGGQNTAPCGQINTVGGYCWATPDAGIVDDMDALDNVCSAADTDGNLQGITAEEIVFLKGNR